MDHLHQSSLSLLEVYIWKTTSKQCVLCTTLTLLLDALAAENYFSFIPMDIHANFYEVFLPSSDDGTVGPIEVPGGLPFSDTVQTDIYVSSK